VDLFQVSLAEFLEPQHKSVPLVHFSLHLECCSFQRLGSKHCRPVEKDAEAIYFLGKLEHPCQPGIAADDGLLKEFHHHIWNSLCRGEVRGPPCQPLVPLYVRDACTKEHFHWNLGKMAKQILTQNLQVRIQTHQPGCLSVGGGGLCQEGMKNNQSQGSGLVDGCVEFQASHLSLNGCRILGYQQILGAFVLWLHLIPAFGMPPPLSAAHWQRGVSATPAEGLENLALLLSPLHAAVFSQDPLIVWIPLLNSALRGRMKYYFDTEAR